MAVFVSAIMLVAGCTSGKGTGPTPGGNPRPTYSLDLPPLPPTGPFQVALIVEAPGVKSLNIGYTIGVGRSGFHPTVDAKVPWKVETVVGPTSTLLLDLVVDAGEQPGQIGISCVIIVDGKVVVQHANFRAVVCHYAL
ncbi:MAG: hypothetical protein V7603_6844 [Micromonosporaceae bacterium]